MLGTCIWPSLNSGASSTFRYCLRWRLEISFKSVHFSPSNMPRAELKSSLEKQYFNIDVATETVFSAGLAMYYLLSSFGLSCDIMLGHSTGEYTALVASGAVTASGAEEYELGQSSIAYIAMSTQRKAFPAVLCSRSALSSPICSRRRSAATKDASWSRSTIVLTRKSFWATR